MKRTPLILVLATGALFLAACGEQEEPIADSSANPLLRFVPADTPYVMANLEPVPAEVVDAYLARMEPLLDEMQSTMAGLQLQLQSEDAEYESDEVRSVAEALFAEFDGKLNRAGMESLGFSLEAMSAVYGHGLFPVARFGLGDPEKVRAMITRVENESGQSLPTETFQGQPYWRAGDPDQPMALYVAILNDHVAFGTAPRLLEGEFLPQLLGLQLPAESMADSGALALLNRDKGFAPYGSGYVDMDRVADELFEADSTTATWMTTLGAFDPAAIDPACEREFRLAATFMPRMVAGTTAVTADEVGLRYQLETSEWLGGQLARLVADVPPAAQGSERLATASMGLQMGRVREFLLDSANAMAAVPFQCPQLQDFNGQIQQLAETLNQPMPPFIGNLKGFRAELSSLDSSDPTPENVRGRLSLEMERPQMVVGMASMMVPGFENLEMEPGGEPVALPRELMTVATPEFEAYAVMSEDAIGIALGAEEADGLVAFLEESVEPEGVFFSVDYDGAALAELQSRTADWTQDAGGDPAAPPMDPAVMSEAYLDMLGRTRMELRFDGDGLTIDQTQTFR